MTTAAELPRTGLPPAFSNPDEYHHTVDTLTRAGEIEDGTKIWWDLRPSARFPTLEMRVSDMRTRLDDAMAIAALYRCTVRMLYRLRRNDQRWRHYSSFLVNENRWLAQRFGSTHALIDFGRGEAVPFAELLDEWIEMTAEDAARFGCEKEVAHARRIVAEGTSADRQLAIYENAVAVGASTRDALKMVVDDLIGETLIGCAGTAEKDHAAATASDRAAATAERR